MKKDELIDAMDSIDDKFLRETDAVRNTSGHKAKIRRIVRNAALVAAACLVIVFAVSECTQMRAGDTPTVTEKIINSINKIVNKEPEMEWPLKSQDTSVAITYSFGSRQNPVTGEELFHNGTDMAYEDWQVEERYVYAALSGTVKETGNNTEDGDYVIVEHEDGYVTVYKNCGCILVSQGNEVSIGDVIAKYGNTSAVSTGAHLHFEVQKDGEFVDPERFLSN